VQSVSHACPPVVWRRRVTSCAGNARFMPGELARPVRKPQCKPGRAGDGQRHAMRHASVDMREERGTPKRGRGAARGLRGVHTRAGRTPRENGSESHARLWSIEGRRRRQSSARRYGKSSRRQPQAYALRTFYDSDIPTLHAKQQRRRTSAKRRACANHRYANRVRA